MTVLISGATGFLGAALLRRIDQPVVALIRGADHEDRARALNRHSLSPVRGVRGDVRRPNWGMDDGTVDELRGTVSAVLNIAGDVGWSAPWARLAETNIDGAANAAALAHRLGARLVHAGSLYVGYDYGAEVGEHLLREREHLTKYERAKLRGEWAVARVARENDLPAFIARIPALSGDLDTPASGSTGARKVPLSRLITSGRWPVLPYSSGARLDVCPRDLVAARVVELLGSEPADTPEVVNIGQAAAAPMVESFIREASIASRRDPSSFPRPVRVPPAWLKAVSRQADRLHESPDTAAAIGMRYFASGTVYSGSGLGREVSVRSLVRTLGMPLADEPTRLNSYYSGWPA
ncbi:SDR family oxidoreductase [Nocardiopsis alborubida]|uniref:NAD-dependent epimerase/dehydratase family protein n=1 Tax=Nocardiopsis alborubida TaxID=146802 RepID=A0A7X6RPG9_9ACTN|nr:SDR family oxidoreductase [Nocardiopsis alborubida]NKY97192.1 NAD-dependent epimerase/dehydratase family protein [Nocardiopsis alborubida]